MFNKVYLGTTPIKKIYLGEVPIKYGSEDTDVQGEPIMIYTVLNGAEYYSPYNIDNKADDWTETIVDNRDGTSTITITASYAPSSLTFRELECLLSIDYFDSSNLTHISGMFYNCTNLISVIGLYNMDTSNMTSMSSMFSGCSSLSSLDGISKWNTSNITDMREMFKGCSSLTSLDMRSWTIRDDCSLSSMVEGCTSLEELRLDNWSLYNISSLVNVNNHFPTFSDGSHIIYCKEDNAYDPVPTGWTYKYLGAPYNEGQFYNNTTLTRVDETTVSVDSTHTDLTEMFYGCSKLEYVDATSWDTSNVTTMSGMFSGCASYISELNLSNWTINGTDISYMFAYNNYINKIDMNNWKITGTIVMIHFDYNTSINVIDMSNWDLSEATLNVSNSSIFKNVQTIRLDNCDKETIRKITNTIGYGTCTNVFIKRANNPGNAYDYDICDGDELFGYSYVD